MTNLTTKNQEIILIPFRGQEILSVKKENKTYIVPKQICQNLGIDWSSQKKRIERDSVLSQGMVMITIPSAWWEQEASCMPIEYLNWWLFGIDESRVKEEIREDIIAYKKECYISLYEYFQKWASINMDRLEDDTELQDFIYRKVRQARTSEKSLWERVKKAFKEWSTDYGENPELVKKFYSLAQDKIHYAVTNKIAAEIVYERIEDNPKENFWMKAYNKDKKTKTSRFTSLKKLFSRKRTFTIWKYLRTTFTKNRTSYFKMMKNHYGRMVFWNESSITRKWISGIIWLFKSKIW